MSMSMSLGCSGTGPSGPAASATSASAHPVAAASPPKDDGESAQGGAGGVSHAAALEQLKAAPLSGRIDKQRSVRVLLPDAGHWTRVRFWGVPSLLGFRYGKDHHAIVGGVVTHVDDNTTPGACAKTFEAWAMPWVQSFEVELVREAPAAFVWTHVGGQPARTTVDVEPIFAKTATLVAHDSYAVAYSAYPAWTGACLIVGVAVPSRDDEARAREVRDRFVREVLPKVEVLTDKEPNEKF